MTDVPSYGDKVWIEGLKQPNGYVVDKDYEAEEVYVKCYDTDELVQVDFDEFDKTNKFMDQWIVNR